MNLKSYCLVALAAGQILAATALLPFHAQARIIIKEWQEQQALPAPVSGHCLAAYESCLILLGGRDAKGKMQSKVLRGSISKAGEISNWTEEEPLPYPISNHSAGIAGGEIYVCGGVIEAHNSRQGSSMVWRARPSRSGKIRSWQEDRPLPGPLQGHMQAAHGEWIYIIGGMGPGGQTSQLLIGQLAGGGGIAEWREGLQLPVPLSRAAALVVGNYLLVAGGVSPGQGKTIAVPTVYVGPIWQDGTIKTWYLASAKLPGAWLGFGRSDASLAFFGNYLFCFGGQDALWFAIRNMAWTIFNPENGEIGGWGLMKTPDKFPQITRVATHGERVYIVGGQDEGRASARVLAGRFDKEKDEK